MNLTNQPAVGFGGLCMPRRTTFKPTALPPAHQQHHSHQAQQQRHEGGEHCLFSRQVTSAGLSGLAAATLLLVPGGQGAQQVVGLPAAAAVEATQAGVLTGSVHTLQGGTRTAANLQGVTTAPALASSRGEGLLEGVVGMVETGLGDLATISAMAPIGGPVTGDVLSEAVPADAGSASSSVPEVTNAQQQQQQQQQQQRQQQQRALHMLWCRAWGAYCRALEASPLSTKVLTGIIGTGLGDLAAQALTHVQTSRRRRSSSCNDSSCKLSSSMSSLSGMRVDSMRTARLCLYSAAIGTPMAHFWYGLLDWAVMPDAPLAPVAVASKVALDQLVQTPLGMALFLGLMKLLEGQPGQVAGELRSKMLPALVANWRMWVPAQLVSFTLVPEDQRILYSNLVGIAWTCIISNMQQESQQQPATADHQEQRQQQAPPDGWRMAVADPPVGPLVPAAARSTEGLEGRLRRSSSSSSAVSLL